MSNMTRAFVVLLVFGCLATVMSTGAQAMMWACDWSGNLYNVNQSNAVLSYIGNTGITELGSLEFGADGTLYGIDNSGTNALWRIDPNTAAATMIGPLGAADFYEGGLAFAPNGTAYAVEAYQATTLNDLVTVDLNTGSATDVAPIGTTYHDINGLMWRSDGQLVGLADDDPGALLTIDPFTGATSTIATLGFNTGALGGMAVDQFSGVDYLATGILTGSNGMLGSNGLYTFDAFTGNTTFVGNFSGVSDDVNGISGLASSMPSTVPEPATLGLLGLGLLGIGLFVRRRA